MSEKSNELIIDPALLADIQRQCRQRAAELEAIPVLCAPPPISEAERFAAAVQEMPANVRRFFEPEDPVPPQRWESGQDRAQRERLADLGGWAGG